MGNSFIKRKDGSLRPENWIDSEEGKQNVMNRLAIMLDEEYSSELFNKLLRKWHGDMDAVNGSVQKLEQKWSYQGVTLEDRKKAKKDFLEWLNEE